MRKSIAFMVMALLASVILCSCNSLPEKYPFKNANDSIVSVELLFNPSAYDRYTGKPFRFLCELDEESALNFMEEIMVLDTGLQHSPPLSNYGFYVARVTYEDGDVELFGTEHIEYVENGNAQKGLGIHYFKGDDFERIFLEYCEANDVEVPPILPWKQRHLMEQWDDSVSPTEEPPEDPATNETNNFHSIIDKIFSLYFTYSRFTWFDILNFFL